MLDLADQVAGRFQTQFLARQHNVYDGTQQDRWVWLCHALNGSSDGSQLSQVVEDWRREWDSNPR